MRKVQTGRVSKPNDGNKVSIKKEAGRFVDGIGQQIDLQGNGGEGALTDSKPSKNKLTGVVIEGKTYTCATCKSGHRVGVCKHAGERPMKPTHAPGRPAAGAPKKVVCDCVKQCTCAKQNCKCQCLCTQVMYMLVYLPGPSEERKASIPGNEDGDGKWKIDREVTTDLNGFILTQEQIEDRQQRKKAQLEDGPTPDALRSRTSSSVTAQDPTSPSQAKPKASGGCCNHSQAVVRERQGVFHAEGNINIQTVHVNPSASTHGCNCGTACMCAFCPQHPNNQTSLSLAQQQVGFISRQQLPLNNNFQTFNAGMSQEASCMGGAPQFAVSRNPMEPSFDNFEEAFPSARGTGHMLAYPIRARITPSPHPPAPPQVPMFPPMIPAGAIPGSDTILLSGDFDYDDLPDSLFDIGEAMVANDGPNGWEQQFLLSDGLWGLPTLPSDFSFEAAPADGSIASLPISPAAQAGQFNFAEFDFGHIGHSVINGHPVINANNPMPRRHTVIPAQMAAAAPHPMLAATSHTPGTEHAFSDSGYFDTNQLMHPLPSPSQQHFPNTS